MSHKNLVSKPLSKSCIQAPAWIHIKNDDYKKNIPKLGLWNERIRKLETLCFFVSFVANKEVKK
jgi:hypothetical protein